MNHQCVYVHFAALLAAVLLAWPAAAQEQRGSIEGVVKDASGAVLPGVTVTVETGTGIKLDTTSDAQGSYRFPSLAPGTYTVSANLAGFGPGKVPDVSVTLGQIKKVDFSLSVAGVTRKRPGHRRVAARRRASRAARQTNIRAEQVALLPHGRDFTTLVTQAPGANKEAKLGGLSIDGASAGENRYIIDGIETTNLQSGLSGKNVIVDFVEEVQVKSSGYTAEYGGATGGVINAITKSGTNAYHGNGAVQLPGQQHDRRPDARVRCRQRHDTGAPTLRISLTDSNKAEYITYPDDSCNRYEPGFALGGPIVKDKVWFFGAYQPALTHDRRATVTRRRR